MTNEKELSDREAYQRAYDKRRREEKRRVTHWVSNEDYEILRMMAIDHGYRGLSTFIRDAAQAYIKQIYLVRDPKQLQELSTGIRRVSALVNQMVMQSHTLRDYDTLERYQQLRDAVYELIAYVRSELEKPVQLTPQALGEYLVRLVEETPAYLEELEQFVIHKRRALSHDTQSPY